MTATKPAVTQAMSPARLTARLIYLTGPAVLLLGALVAMLVGW